MGLLMEIPVSDQRRRGEGKHDSSKGTAFTQALVRGPRVGWAAVMQGLRNPSSQGAEPGLEVWQE